MYFSCEMVSNSHQTCLLPGNFDYSENRIIVEINPTFSWNKEVLNKKFF